MELKKMVRLAVFTAFGFLLMYFIAFPIPPFPGFLTYDPGDIPGLIATFAFGPLSGVLVQLLKCVIGYLIGASRAGLIGMAANFVSGGTVVLIAGLIYQKWRTLKGAIVSLLSATITASLVMAVADYFIFFPLWGIPTNEALPLLVSAVLPFNLIKFTVSSAITFLIYKKIKGISIVKEEKIV